MKGLLVVLMTVGLLAACSSSSKTIDAVAVMAEAKAQVDAAPTIHLALTATGGSFQAVTGSLKRPDGFTGSITVGGVDVPLISSGGGVFAKLPLTTSYAKIDPAKYGLSDPGALFSPTTGLSTLLTAPTDLKAGKQIRIGGDVSDQITGTLPGATVATVLPGTPTGSTVSVTFGVIDSSGQLRRVQITAGSTSYTLTLDGYGDPVTIPTP